MRAFHTTFMVAAMSVTIAGTAVAQSNLEKLGAMHTTGVTEITYIDQSGANAAAIRKTLERIKMPAGFKIDLYAVVPDARHMAIDPNGVVLFVGTKKPTFGRLRTGTRIASPTRSSASHPPSTS